MGTVLALSGTATVAHLLLVGAQHAPVDVLLLGILEAIARGALAISATAGEFDGLSDGLSVSLPPDAQRRTRLDAPGAP